MAEQTNIQIDTLARAIQIVTDFLAGRPQQGVASLEQAIARAEAALIKAGLSPTVAKGMSQQILLSAGSRDSSGLSSPLDIARNHSLIALAVWFGKARLIDNIELSR